jgi:hypothetical protein
VTWCDLEFHFLGGLSRIFPRAGAAILIKVVG